MEFKGTKGPWYVGNGGIQHLGECILVADKPKTKMFSPLVCVISGVESLTKEDLANAKLISKAPELLEILQVVLDNSDIPNEIYDKAKQLIKEATEL